MSLICAIPSARGIKVSQTDGIAADNVYVTKIQLFDILLCWALPTMHGTGLAVNLVKYEYENITDYSKFLTGAPDSQFTKPLLAHACCALIINLITITKITSTAARSKDLKL